MASARFSIGIDLGTTNCVMAFEALDETSSHTEVFPVSQLETDALFVESTTLPSFLYLPPREAAESSGSATTGDQWIPGRLARKKAAESPGRVAHSAKSWLCHHTVDRTAQFLPWRSDEVHQDKRISPIQASALLLKYLRAAWESVRNGEGLRFDDQEITITVPASFDAAAQTLTLQAASEAGYPERVRLLEEPQAAFYCWLEEHDLATGAAEQVDGHVLVIDIGGGTTDFSLFEINNRAAAGVPRIRRVAVSDHLLLGGDNIDLAIAHRLESRLSDKPLAPAQWNFLVARCRDLKEQCFSDSALDAFPVAVPSRGSTLLGGTLSCRIARAEIEEIVLAGFFPDCALESKPARAYSGLREWALPYAADSGVTRYLAEFLNHRPPIDAVLFNGGSLYPEVLRVRLVEQIGRWQNGARPRMLINSEPGLAVARGAARFGKIVHHRSRRIEADAARSLYLEVHKKPGQTEQNAARTLLCILAADSPTEEEFQISDIGLELRVNRAVRFQAYASTRRPRDRIGQLVIWNEQEFRQLPSLQTTAKLSSHGSGGDRLPVSLRVSINELGLLRIACLSAQPGIRETWPLEFNLRADEEPRSERGESGSEPRFDPGIGTVNLENAKTRIRKVFSQPLDNRDKLSASNLFKSLERMAGAPKAAWNWGLVRSFWQTLAECHPDRSRSIEHDETWLILSGFFLRPGFGGDGDEYRIDRLWRLQKERPENPSKRIQIQQFVLWRRVAGGLDRERQNEILAPEMPRLAAARNASPELVRLAGAFEKIEVNRKIEVFHLFLGAARELAAGNRSCAPYLSSLGLLLNRAPLCSNSDSVLPADFVEKAFNALSSFEWSEPDLGEVQTLFLRAARVVDDPKIDLPKALRQKIASWLERLGVPPTKLARIRSFVPMGTGDRASLFGEALPPGLVLSE